MKTFVTTVGISVICFSALGGGMVNNLAQADLEAALADGGTVLFGTSGTLTLTNTITIPVDTTLDANGNQVIISGGNSVQLFQVASNITFGIKGLILADGRVVAATGNAFGACIWNQGGNVILTGCSLTNNSAQGANGTGGAAFGGAIYTVGGSLSMTNCFMALNHVVGGTGSPPPGPAGAAGPGGSALGGAIYSESALVILRAVQMNSNTATGGASVAGSLANPAGPGGNGFGGALYAAGPSIINISSSQVLSNTAKGGGVPFGGTMGAASGDGAGGGLFVSTNSSGDIQLTTFDQNCAVGGQGARYYGGGSGKGGHIFTAGNLHVTDSSFSGGLASGGLSLAPGVGRGGAICSAGSLTINGSALFENATIGGNAEPATFSVWPGTPGEGGALWASGILACTNTTIAACQALGGSGGGFMGGGPGGAGIGGGLYLTNVTAVIVNLTVATNRADGTNIWNPTPPELAGPALGGNLAATNATVTILNSIVANSGNGGDVWGSITDGGYNISSDGTANFSTPGSLNQVDPLLAVLSNNGGPTPTMALLVGSPARDAIISGFPPVDQRGVSRPQGPAADIGAFEATPGAVAPRLIPARFGQTLTITLNAEAGRTYRLLSSTNLSTWFSLATNSTISAGQIQFVQPIAGSNNFYQVVTP